jgi:hypothetical protein
VKGLFAGRQRAEMVLAEHEVAPKTWKEPLLAELTKVGVDDDLVATAQALMRLIDAEGSRAGKYNVDARGSQGVQVGDGNTQHNIGTYINNQMIGASAPSTPDETIGPNTSLNSLVAIASDRMVLTRSRMKVAEQAAKVNKRQGALAYGAIAADPSVRTRDRAMAARWAAKLRDG